MVVKCWVYVACQGTCQLLVALMAHLCQDQVLSSVFASLLQALWFCVQQCVGQCVFSLRSMSCLGINLKHAILQCSPKSCFIVKVKAGSCRFNPEQQTCTAGPVCESIMPSDIRQPISCSFHHTQSGNLSKTTAWKTDLSGQSCSWL